MNARSAGWRRRRSGASRRWRPLASAARHCSADTEPPLSEKVAGVASTTSHGDDRAPGVEILFLDPRVGDAHALLRSLRPGVEAVLLDASRSAAPQMAAVL